MTEPFDAVIEFGGSVYHRDLFEEMWVRWYKHNLLYGDAGEHGVERITATSGQLAEVIYPYAHVTPPLKDAGLFARRAIEDQIGYTWDTVLIKDKRLGELARSFAQTKLCPLLKRYDRDIMSPDYYDKIAYND